MVRHSCQRFLDLLRLRRLNRGDLFGLEMYQVLADSLLTLNSHIDAAGAQAANMRLFEATGMGTCLVTDWKQNLGSLFDLDREIVTYRNPAECCEKIRFLIDHPATRNTIAKAGQVRTLKDHSLRAEVLRFDNFMLTQL